MRRLIALAMAAVFAGVAVAAGVSPASALCKEQCQKHCMGNDTPTERAECLKREKCESQAACPTGATGAGTGTKFDPGGSPPKPTIRVPKVDPDGGVMQR